MFHRLLAICLLFASSGCLNFDFKSTRIVNPTTIAPSFAPKLVESIPKDGASDVSINTSLELFFSAEMDTATLVVSSTPVVNARFVRWAPETRAALFLFDDPLLETTAYTFSVSGKTASGAELEGETVVGFSTISPPVVVPPTPPSVQATLPAAGAMGVATDSGFFVTFTKPMNDATVSLTTTSELVLPLPTWNTERTQALWDLPALADATTYVFTLEGRDVGGSSLTGATTFSFTTAAAQDVTDPTMVFHTPAQELGNAINLTAITVTFSEPMLASSAIAGSMTVTGSSAPACTLSWAGDSQLVCTLPSMYSFIQNQQYTVAVTSALKDLAGRSLVPASFTFTANLAPDVVAPVLLKWGMTSFASWVTAPSPNPWDNPKPPSVDPRGVRTSAKLVLVFSEPVQNLGGTKTTPPLMELRRNGIASDLIGFTATQMADPNAQQITPNAAAVVKGDYIQWVILPTLTDMSGRSIAGGSLSGKWRYQDERLDAEVIATSSLDGWIHGSNPRTVSTASSTLYVGDFSANGEYDYVRSFLSFTISNIGSDIKKLLRADLVLCQLGALAFDGTPFSSLGNVYIESVVDYSDNGGLDSGDLYTSVDPCPSPISCNASNPDALTFSSAPATNNEVRPLNVTTWINDDLFTYSRARAQFRLKQSAGPGAAPAARHLTKFYSSDASDADCVAPNKQRPRLLLDYEWLGEAIPP